MKTRRTKVGYSKWLGDFRTHVYVACPKCGNQALVRKPPEQESHSFTNTKVTCQHCGFNQASEGNVISDLRLSYWLEMECEGETLWAYNYEHLIFLKQLIGANLRERNGLPNANSSLGSRLPRWMTSGKNRRKVMKCLERLQQR